MTPRPVCRCLLCQIEQQLIREITSSVTEYEALLNSTANGLRSFTSPFHLLAHLKATHADSSSDDLYRELLAARVARPQLVETLMILAFVPVLHGTVRRIAKHQSNLARADITQQALTVFLQALRSGQIENRHSHIVFAISRLVKRRLFEWAGREGTVHSPVKAEDRLVVELNDDAWIERLAALRHFLNRCVAHRFLSHAELELLIQSKLDGNTGEEIAELNGTSSNAVRQRVKRLLAKLRRLARAADRSTARFSRTSCDTFFPPTTERKERGEFTPKESMR